MAKRSPKKKPIPKKPKAKKERKKRKGQSKPKKTPSKKKKKRKPNLYMRIRSICWRKHKKDFEGKAYKDKDGKFLTIVREVYNDCKSFGADCKKRIILDKYADIESDERRPKPVLASDLTNPKKPKEYYQIKDVEFAVMAPYLWVVSPMIIFPPSEFKITDYVKADGDTDAGYRKYFKEWVDWCNMVHRERSPDFGSEEIEIFFYFTEPEWNKEKKRWETEIMICTSTGEIDSFGFKSEGKGAEHEPQEFEEPKEKPKEKEKKKEEEDKEKKKEDAIDRKLDRLLKIKKDKMEEIKMWKEIGEKEELKEAIKELKAIKKQIKDLTT